MMERIRMNKRHGFYLVFEGIEGCGKSTQVKLLHDRLVHEFSEEKVLAVREPGGTQIGDAIREILLSKKISDKPMEPLVEAYLFAAARGQLLREVVQPALKKGKIVVSDRSFFTSLAYQGFGRSLGWREVWQINRRAVGRCLPDLVIWPDLPPEVGLQRKNNKDLEINRLDEEKIDFYQRAREGYQIIARENLAPFLLIDGCLSVETQADLIWQEVLPNLSRT